MITVTVRQALDRASRSLARAGVATDRLDAELMLAHAMGVDRSMVQLHPERAISTPVERRFDVLTERRCRREPVSHILGEREFWSLPFEVGPKVLDPRPDSETLIEAACARFQPQEVGSILDLGTGSGCLLVALLREFPEAKGVGVDIDADAIAVARRNARRNGVDARATFIIGGWDAAGEEKFDIIVSNPPYIPSAEISRLSPEVRDFEPRRALDGGCDGLEAYRGLLPHLKTALTAKGAGFLEVGAGQAYSVAALAKAAGLKVAAIRRDLGGIERCIMI